MQALELSATISDLWRYVDIFPEYLEQHSIALENGNWPDISELDGIDMAGGLIIDESSPRNLQDTFLFYLKRGEFVAAASLMDKLNLGKEFTQEFEQWRLRKKDDLERELRSARTYVQTLYTQGAGHSAQKVSGYDEKVTALSKTYEQRQRFGKTITECKSVLDALIQDIETRKNELAVRARKIEGKIEESDHEHRQLIVKAVTQAKEYLTKGEYLQSENRLQLADDLLLNRRVDLTDIEKDLSPHASEVPHRLNAQRFREEKYSVEEVVKWLREAQLLKRKSGRSKALEGRFKTWLDHCCPLRVNECAQAYNVMKALSDARKARKKDRQEDLLSKMCKEFCRMYGLDMLRESLLPLDQKKDVLVTYVNMPEPPLFFSALSREKNVDGIPLLVIANPDITPERLAGAMKNANITQSPSLAISIKHQRRDWIRRVKEQGLPIAIIDENTLIRTLGAGSEQWYRQLMLEIIPEFSLELISPYQEQGVVPREMFFGRDREIRLLQNDSSPTIIFGGRKLGKSSLLKRVAEEFNQIPKQVAVYLDIWPVGRPQPTMEVCRRLIRELAIHTEPIDAPENISDFRSRIEWILQNYPDTKFLCLIDEADGYFRQEQANQYEISAELRSLQVESANRIRFIFAGFEDIHRASVKPNSPFYNFNGQRPKAITPLSREAARQLLTLPLAYLGFYFEDESALVDRILMYTANHPSLLQLFCRKLADDLLGRRRSSEVIIDSADVDNVYLNQEFRRNALDTLKLNLEVADERLKYLFYRILFEQSQGETFSAETRFFNQIDVFEWCKNEKVRAFSGPGEVQTLLEELTALGLLQVGQKGYFVHNSSVTQLLAEFEDVEMTVLEVGQKLEKVISPTSQERQGFFALSPEDEQRLLGASKQSFLILGGPKSGKSDVIGKYYERMAEDRVDYLYGPIAITHKEGLTAFWAQLAKAFKSKKKSPSEIMKSVVAHCNDETSDTETVVFTLDGLESLPIDSIISYLDQLSNLILESNQNIQILATGGVRVAKALLRSEENVLVAFSPISLARISEQDFSNWSEQKGFLMTNEAASLAWDKTMGYPGLMSFLFAMYAQEGDTQSRIFNLTEVEEMVSILEDYPESTERLNDVKLQTWWQDLAKSISSVDCSSVPALSCLISNSDTLVGLEDAELLELEFGIEIELGKIEEDIRALVLIGVLDSVGAGNEGLGVLRANDVFLKIWSKIVEAAGA
jgi:hypothetical protein